ncbi:MAG: hypothetical protein ABIO76_05205 [Ginsengibacter sp.]
MDISFYKKPFSHYLLAVEYRFVGKQVKGGEGWAYKNSGIMLHCQPSSKQALHFQTPGSPENPSIHLHPM